MDNSKFLSLIGVISFISCGFAFNGFSLKFNTHEEPPIDVDGYKSTFPFMVKEKWIRQKLDHFNAENSKDWNMRYLENDQFFQPGKKFPHLNLLSYFS